MEEFVTTYIIERVAKDKNNNELSSIKAVTQKEDEIKRYVLMFAKEALETKEKYKTINTTIHVTVYDREGIGYCRFIVADFDSEIKWINCAPIYGSRSLSDKEREEYKKRFYFELRLSGEYDTYVPKNRKGQ